MLRNMQSSRFQVGSERLALKKMSIFSSIAKAVIGREGKGGCFKKHLLVGAAL